MAYTNRNNKSPHKNLTILYLPNQYSQQRQREKKRWIYPVLLAMEAEYRRQQGDHVAWNMSRYSDFFDKIITKPEGLPFLELPWPDRKFTSAMDEKYQNNGNFKYKLGTYILSAKGCWHGKCTFCVEQNKPYEVRPINDVIGEIEECIKLGFKEVFDDSGTFPTGDWLHKFCTDLVKINSRMRFSCNMRMVDVDYNLMRRAGFRMVLFGLESANQATLERINKGVQVEDIKYIIKAAKARLEPHVAVIFGYPWESDSDAINTLKLVHWLLKKGYAKTAQASLYSVPGVTSNREHRKYGRAIYKVAYSPQFWFNKIRDIHNVADLKYLWRMIKEGIGAL